MDDLTTLDFPMTDEPPKRLSIKLPADVIELARVVAVLRGGTTISDLVAGILRPILKEMEQEALARRSTPSPKKKGRKGR